MGAVRGKKLKKPTPAPSPRAPRPVPPQRKGSGEDLIKGNGEFVCQVSPNGDTTYVFKNTRNATERIGCRGSHDACRIWQKEYRGAKRQLLKHMKPNVSASALQWAQKWVQNQ